MLFLLVDSKSEIQGPRAISTGVSKSVPPSQEHKAHEVRLKTVWPVGNRVKWAKHQDQVPPTSGLIAVAPKAHLVAPVPHVPAVVWDTKTAVLLVQDFLGGLG